MMFGLYTEKDVKALVCRLKEEYGAALAKSRALLAELAEENSALKARVLALEGERGNVSEALIAASREGERIVREGKEAAESERRELALLAEKCRLLSDRLLKKYPDEEDVREYASFCDELHSLLGGEEEESGFDLEECTSPKGPLDLEQLCRDLGLMEDGDEDNE